MSNFIKPYSTIEDIEDKVCPIYCMNYSYLEKNGEKVNLNIIEEGTQTVLEDSDNNWEFRLHGLTVKGEIILNNIDYLFGMDGLVSEDATIGVALQILSKKSSQQYSRIIDRITNDHNSPFRIEFEEHISKDKIYGNFTIRIVLFLNTPSSSSLFGKANNPGMMLGSIFNQTFDIDGDMSALPIVEISDKSKPLWYVEYNIDDPTVDAFDTDHVCIYFNSAHPGFKYLEKKESSFSKYLQTEVMASALTQIIVHVMSLTEWSYIKNEEGVEEGSIGATINYFRSTFNWNFESPEKISESIRLYFQTIGDDDVE